jgi:hypothetical protein
VGRPPHRAQGKISNELRFSFIPLSDAVDHPRSHLGETNHERRRGVQAYGTDIRDDTNHFTLVKTSPRRNAGLSNGTFAGRILPKDSSVTRFTNSIWSLSTSAHFNSFQNVSQPHSLGGGAVSRYTAPSAGCPWRVIR